MLDIFVFNVKDGQSIFFYPRNNPEYGMLIDCHESDDFRPIDFLVKNGFVYHDNQKQRYVLSNLTITNYDNDHFSGITEILKKVHIDTVRLPKNISSSELVECKEEKTQALQDVCYLKDTYTSSALYHKPPYKIIPYHLEQSDFQDEEVNTNYLSQIVFVEYDGSQMCICGDLEKPAWELILQKTGVIENLKKTNVMIAPHHGRENGYHENVFRYCSPECIVISDKEMMHETQEAMSQTYSNHVSEKGIVLNGNYSNPRKVLTTRCDGHIWIRFHEGNREYKSF